MAGEGDAERLVVLLEARIRDFERNMQKASGTARRSYDEIAAGSSRASKTMSKNFADAAAKASTSLASFGKGFVGGLAAGAVAEFTNAIRGAVTSVAELKAQSQQAGVGVEAFQMLGAAAEQARVGTDALVDGLKEMQLRIDEFITTGAGSAADSLRRIGYDAATLKAGLADIPTLFLDIIGRVQQLDQAARIRVLDELFGGTAGEQFIRLADLGAEKIRDIGQAAKDSGAVIESELIDRAAVLDAQWSLMARTIRTEVVGAILEASKAMGPLIEQSNALGASFDRFLANPSWVNFNAFMTGAPMIEKMAQKLAPPGPADNSREMQRQRAFQERTQAPRGIVEDRLTRARATDGPPIPQNNLPPLPYRPPNLLGYDPYAGGGGGGGGGSRGGGAAAARTQNDAVKELITSLEEELALVGKSDAEREVSNNLRQAGAEATDAERARITELTKALSDQEEAYRKNSEAAEEMQGVAKDALKGLISDLKSGKDAGEALANALDRLTDKLLDMVLNSIFDGKGGGGLGNLIGSLLGGIGKNAKGTDNWRGGLSVVGEKGPEVVNIPRGAQVIPNDVLRRAPAPAAAPAAPTIAPQFNTFIQNNAPGVRVREDDDQKNKTGGRDMHVVIDEVQASNIKRPGSQSFRALQSFSRPVRRGG